MEIKKFGKERNSYFFNYICVVGGIFDFKKFIYGLYK